MKERHMIRVFCVVPALLFGCQSPPEPKGIERADSVAAAVADGDSVPGYIHKQVDSLFNVGPHSVDVSEAGYLKSVGDYGVFGTRPSNGLVMAIPNGDAPTTQLGPLTSNPDAHNSRVLSYFVAAGLPQDQVLRVRISAAMRSIGQTSDPAATAPATVFDSYSSVLDRGIGGVRVVGSYAWARFNENNEVSAEEIYWPQLPGSAIDEANSLAQLVADPVRVQLFRDQFGLGKAKLEVVIRHTDSTIDSPFEARGVIDAMFSTGMGTSYIRHFTMDGSELRFPQERAGLLPSTPK